MCIICVSKKGIQQPDRATLAQMFNANPDGAGYMTARNGMRFGHAAAGNMNDPRDIEVLFICILRNAEQLFHIHLASPVVAG